MTEATFFKKILRIMIFTLITISLLGNATAANHDWTLTLDGAVNKPLNLTLSELAAMPRSTVNSELYCLGSLVTSGDWVGVKLGYLLETAGLQNEAASLTFVAQDGYEVVFDLTDALHENVIIAYELDGHLLSETLRLVVPWKNGAQWIAWITKITVTTISVSTPSNNAYLPPQLSQPPSMPHSTYTPQPSDQPTTPPADPLPTQELDAPLPNQQSQEPKPPAPTGSALLTLILAIVASTTAYLILKRKKQQQAIAE